MSFRTPRFPGIDWYCDRCHARLNSQTNFDDHHYIWKCTKCGYKTSISLANITFDTSPSKFINVLGKTLGALRALIVYFCVLLLLNRFAFKAELSMPLWVLPVSGIVYLALDIFSMFFEKIIAKYHNRQRLPIWVLTTFFIYLGGDLFRIIREPFHMVKTIISYIFSKKKWRFHLIETIVLGLVYTAILVAFIEVVIWLTSNF